MCHLVPFAMGEQNSIVIPHQIYYFWVVISDPLDIDMSLETCNPNRQPSYDMPESSSSDGDAESGSEDDDGDDDGENRQPDYDIPDSTSDEEESDVEKEEDTIPEKVIDGSHHVQSDEQNKTDDGQSRQDNSELVNDAAQVDITCEVLKEQASDRTCSKGDTTSSTVASNDTNR